MRAKVRMEEVGVDGWVLPLLTKVAILTQIEHFSQT